MEQDRAEVELTIQIGAEEDADASSILLREARKHARRLLEMPHAAELIHEEQWCSGALRVTLRRPRLAPTPAQRPSAPEAMEAALSSLLREARQA